MNKNAMRSMGVGILISAVLLSGYAFFTDGDTTNTEGENTEVLASLESENSQLKSDQVSLNDEIAQFYGLKMKEGPASFELGRGEIFINETMAKKLNLYL